MPTERGRSWRKLPHANSYRAVRRAWEEPGDTAAVGVLTCHALEEAVSCRRRTGAQEQYGHCHHHALVHHHVPRPALESSAWITQALALPLKRSSCFRV
ncbi:MAG: hypothetical protein ACPIOQ_00625 [Promethearchaeia archaeon]